jgi:hypothetical protein
MGKSEITRLQLREKAIPQGLKPRLCPSVHVGAKAPTPGAKDTSATCKAHVTEPKSTARNGCITGRNINTEHTEIRTQRTQRRKRRTVFVTARINLELR